MSIDIDPDLLAAASTAKAWPFEEARRLIKRLERNKDGQEKTVIFETGYGPSGLPHIGTFGEVARTSMVRHAFNVLTEGRRKTRLICFSDDMDGLRKVPSNVPNQEMLKEYLDKPLSRVPDPFSSEHPSFAAHNNARLRAFLDSFGFDYEFYSATECYTSGMMDATLLRMLAAYDDVMNIILPTLGAERRATYSPFLPVCPRTGKVLQVPMIARNVEAGTVTYVDPETGENVETKVTGGAVKCQWKADWAMRWVALGVDYEMAGKDLIDSVTLSSKIARALGGTPPEGFNYELFLDEKGEKISKSKGNGLTIDEWLTYASPASLALFMFQKPKTAKRLYFDIIPKTVDEYLQFLASYEGQDAKQKLENPVWHLHDGHPPAAELPISFALLLNLVSASNAEDKQVLWGFIRRRAPGATAENHPLLDELADYALTYYRDFVAPTKQFRAANEQERQALSALDAALAAAPADASGADLQNLVYEAGKSNGYTKETLREWFKAIYEVLLGSSQGPRFGSFVELYGIDNTRTLIAKGLNGELIK
ncbi:MULTISPECIES: lysine--tRNA ligase [Filomicrobium]|uniref:Lysine--tRNA ligase n=1 Tax=Filomicrobium insigne TaxID=418854 RepID=A0A1H0HA29_9HYPH|nr:MULTISPECIES: lysine--tRNA ligase [Filomicrobium]MCV0367812.1 lysine--tRNA ligase [Filomicrobium sp.]SDO15978.1 lysyl-tRNA synthetase, class I [Filomicrobium insigne]